MQRVAVSTAFACVIVGVLYADSQVSPGLKASVAHRGASAYAPEHTLAAYRLAIAQGADYVEQDLALTRDGVLICLHDESLERTTNVEEVFPDRATVDRVSGKRRWLAADLALAEIKRLDAGSWFDRRFAGERVPTWEEAVAAVGSTAGLYPELKAPALYRDRGISMTRLFADSLRALGPAARPAGAIVVQSFDDRSLRQLAEILPHIPRTFLIDRDGARWLSADGLAEVARFATGIGPSKELIDGRADLVDAARQAGLTVTPLDLHIEGTRHTLPERTRRDAVLPVRSGCRRGLYRQPGPVSARCRRTIVPRSGAIRSCSRAFHSRSRQAGQLLGGARTICHIRYGNDAQSQHGRYQLS